MFRSEGVCSDAQFHPSVAISRNSVSMKPVKAIEQMTQEEKLLTMESLWDSLWPAQEGIPSPGWHGAVLQGRADRVASGKAVFSDWDAAKKRLSGQS